MRVLMLFALWCVGLIAMPVHAEEPEQGVGALAYLPALAGDYFALESQHTESTYHIFVRLPEGYQDQPERRWPVVYLLDGDSTFPMLAPQHLFLHYDEGLTEAILVGIAYGGFGETNRRGFDFRPVLEGGGVGGSSDFLAMLERELLPKIDANYRTRPDRRVILGQSRSAAFVLYAAVERPALFHGYIASNPGREYPDRTLYGMGRPMPTIKTDGLLVLASGQRDYDYLRSTAIEWSKTFAKRTDLPWRAQFLDIGGGTHAASLPTVYRQAMLAIFPPAPD